MSNGTRKKKVDFKKLLITEEDSSSHQRKKSLKSSALSQNGLNKKEKSQKKAENKEKSSEKNVTRKIKSKNMKDKEKINMTEFIDKLKDFNEEINFLNKKRNSDMNIDRIINIQKNSINNKTNGALNNINNTNNTITENKNNLKNKKNDNINDININKNNNSDDKINNTNNNSALIIDFYKLYFNLFETNRLDNSKPYKFVDYLITGDNYLFNIKKDKNKLEEIKKGISIKQKNNNFLINDHLLNKTTYEYLKCDFSNSFIKKLSEKINIFLMNRYTNKKKKISNMDNNSLSLEKKDKFTYSNFLSDKLKENTNKSILSFTNDTEYFKSLIYVCNKYSKYTGKKETPEKILIESLEKNKKILEKFKHENSAKKIEGGYLKDLLKNKGIRNYMKKKLKNFGEDAVKNNKILNKLDINIFYKIFEIIIKNKSDDDVDKIYKILYDELYLSSSDSPDNFDKNDLKNYLIELRFLLDLEILNNIKDNKTSNNNYIIILKNIYKYIDKYITKNEQENYGNDNNSGKKAKSKYKNSLKLKKDSKDDLTENDSSNFEIKNSSIINNANTNDISNNIDIEQNDKQIDNEINKNSSKIIPFKIPYPKSNSSNNINSNNNSNNSQSTKLSLFEINIFTDSQKNEINTKNLYKNQNKGENSNTVEKTFFEAEKKENIKNKNKRRKKKENKNSSDNTSINDNNINENIFNNCITFNSINNSKNLNMKNIGKYLLNKLSSGQDIFKLVVEKPKMKKLKEKSKEKDKEIESSINSEFENKKDDKDKDNKEKEEIKLNETMKEKYIKDAETRENSSKSTTKNEKNEKIDLGINANISQNNSNFFDFNKIEKNLNLKQPITTSYIFSNYKNKKNKNKIKSNMLNNDINSDKNININLNATPNQRNIDTIKFNNNSPKEITRNDIIHSPNICVKISQKDINQKNTKFLFLTNKSGLNKINRNDNNQNINIKIDRQSLEIRGGNVILNFKRENNCEDILKINDSLGTC